MTPAKFMLKLNYHCESVVGGSVSSSEVTGVMGKSVLMNGLMPLISHANEMTSGC
jgi:hypothetical protein